MVDSVISARSCLPSSGRERESGASGQAMRLPQHRENVPSNGHSPRESVFAEANRAQPKSFFSQLFSYCDGSGVSENERVNEQVLKDDPPMQTPPSAHHSESASKRDSQLSRLPPRDKPTNKLPNTCETKERGVSKIEPNGVPLPEPLNVREPKANPSRNRRGNSVEAGVFVRIQNRGKGWILADSLTKFPLATYGHGPTYLKEPAAEMPGLADEAKRSVGEWGTFFGGIGTRIKALFTEDSLKIPEDQNAESPAARLDQSSVGGYLADKFIYEVFGVDPKQDNSKEMLKEQLGGYLDSMEPRSKFSLAMPSSARVGVRFPVGEFVKSPVGLEPGIELNVVHTTGISFEKRDNSNFDITMKSDKDVNFSARFAVSLGFGGEAESGFVWAGAAIGIEYDKERNLTLKDVPKELAQKFMNGTVDHDLRNVFSKAEHPAEHVKTKQVYGTGWLSGGVGAAPPNIAAGNATQVGGAFGGVFGGLIAKAPLGKGSHEIWSSKPGENGREKSDYQKEVNKNAHTTVGFSSQALVGIYGHIGSGPQHGTNADSLNMWGPTGGGGVNGPFHGAKDAEWVQNHRLGKKQGERTDDEHKYSRKKTVIPTKWERYGNRDASSKNMADVFGKNADLIQKIAIAKIKEKTGEDYDVRKRNLVFDVEYQVKPQVRQQLWTAAQKEAQGDLDKAEKLLESTMQTLLHEPGKNAKDLEYSVSVSEEKSFAQGIEIGVPVFARVAHEVDFSFKRHFDISEELSELHKDFSMIEPRGRDFDHHGREINGKHPA